MLGARHAWARVPPRGRGRFRSQSWRRGHRRRNEKLALDETAGGSPTGLCAPKSRRSSASRFLPSVGEVVERPESSARAWVSLQTRQVRSSQPSLGCRMPAAPGLATPGESFVPRSRDKTAWRRRMVWRASRRRIVPRRREPTTRRRPPRGRPAAASPGGAL